MVRRWTALWRRHPRRKSSGVSKAIAIWALSFTRLEANRNLLTAMSLLPKSIHRCRRYPTKFNSGRDIPTEKGLGAWFFVGPAIYNGPASIRGHPN